ncbi:hypothetical protein ABZ498_18760 [Streptomyces lavendulocolor]|uniref:hypothetical protein n=1 Tax=Streptomyces lavendulocolor TaxID=67316 RepID=UPI0033C95A53
MLSLVSTPAAASLQERGPVAASSICPPGQPMSSAPGFEGIYALRYNAERNCASLTNISHERDADARNGRVLLLRGDGQVSEPLRFNNPVGWIRHTTASAVEEAETTGSVVLLPGETASYSPADNRYTYNVDVADAQVSQVAKVAESLATQAANDVIKNPADQNRSNDLTNSIVKCASATKEAWAEQDPGNTGFPTVITKMKTLPECESTYARIDQLKGKKPLPKLSEGGWRQTLRDYASFYDDVWSQGLLNEAKKVVRIIIGGGPR